MSSSNIPPDKLLTLDIFIKTLSGINNHNAFPQESYDVDIGKNLEITSNSSDFSHNVISEKRSDNAEFNINNPYSDCDFYSGGDDEIQEPANVHSALSKKRNYFTSSTEEVAQKKPNNIVTVQITDLLKSNGLGSSSNVVSGDNIAEINQDVLNPVNTHPFQVSH